MTITIEQVKEAKELARQAHHDYKTLLAAYAHQECPLSVGEITTVTGFAHTGKKMIVEYIGPGDPPGDFGYRGAWVAKGPVLKNDGTPGKHRGEVSASKYIGDTDD